MIWWSRPHGECGIKCRVVRDCESLPPANQFMFYSLTPAFRAQSLKHEVTSSWGACAREKKIRLLASGGLKHIQ